MSRQTNTRMPITLKPRRPRRRRFNHEAGIKPGTIHLNLLTRSKISVARLIS